MPMIPKRGHEISFTMQKYETNPTGVDNTRLVSNSNTFIKDSHTLNQEKSGTSSCNTGSTTTDSILFLFL